MAELGLGDVTRALSSLSALSSPLGSEFSLFLSGVDWLSLVFSVDGQTVLTRGGDDTVKRESSNTSDLCNN